MAWPWNLSEMLFRGHWLPNSENVWWYVYMFKHNTGHVMDGQTFCNSYTVFLLHKIWHLCTARFYLALRSTIGVNFYKAARLEPPTFQTPRLSGFWASQFPVTCNAYYEALLWSTEQQNDSKWYSCQSDHQFRSTFSTFPKTIQSSWHYVIIYSRS